MKKQALFILSALILTAMVGIGQASGQTVNASRFDIPFDFTVRGKLLPAGSYTVQWSYLPHSGFQVMKSTKDNRTVTFPIVPSAVRVAPEESCLAFNRYKDRYSLRELWGAGLETGSEVVKTESERRAEREISVSGTKPEQVIIAAKKP